MAAPQHFVRSSTSKTIGHLLLAAALLAWSTAAMAQDAEVHVQPRFLAQTESQGSQPAQPEPYPQEPQPPNNEARTVTIPAGTRLPLVLARPLSLKHSHAGDIAYLQTTFPISAGGEMAIPPGTFLQGTIDKITRRDKLYRVMAFDLHSVQVIFATGYTVPLPGPLDTNPVLSGLDRPDLNDSNSVPVLAASGGSTPPALPPLPPLPGNGARNAIIGIGIASTVGILVISAIAIHNSDILMEPGTSMEAVLTMPLVLDQDRVIQAVQQYAAETAMAPPQIPQSPKMGTCWTAGTPGTADTIIPGTPPTIIPGTPPITIPGDPPTTIPGTPDTIIPGSPDTIIHGTPGTDPAPYPCPR